MKKLAMILCTLLIWTAVGGAAAEKARDIADDAASAYHLSHLARHMLAEDLHGTGNYLKVRELPMPSNVFGHMEQADQFILLALKNGYAKIVVTKPDWTSPDSWVGLTGWVDADYLDCSCNDAQYEGASPLPSAGEAAAAPSIPADAAGSYVFCSGAGAWMTEMTLLPNGMFFGHYHDTDMGDADTPYPNGTVYFCDFSGRFGSLQTTDEHSGTLALTSLTPYEAKDHIRDGVRYIASEPYGFENSQCFVLYSPGTPVDALPTECVQWLQGSMGEAPNGQLACYVIYNPVEGFAFSQQPE